MKIDNTYLVYNNFLSNIDINFKRHCDFTYMLEHVSHEFGLQYKKLIENEFNSNIENYTDLIKINDSIGNPSIYDIEGFHISPSNLRYIYHALLIKSKIENWYNKNDIKIIEIGGGYGGLCFYLKNIMKNHKLNYSIIDLPNVTQLQKYYFNKTDLDIDIISCFDIDKINENYDLVISNYCISEIEMNNRLEYLNKLTNKCSKKFYTWNSTSFEGLNLEEYIIEDERPQTNYQNYNKFIYSKNI
jgi:hypothetical protein